MSNTETENVKNLFAVAGSLSIDLFATEEDGVKGYCAEIHGVSEGPFGYALLSGATATEVLQAIVAALEGK